MTDFFADLRADLLEAAEREARRSRAARLRAALPGRAVVRVAAAAAACLVLLAGVAMLAGGDGSERAAAPKPPEVDGATDGWDQGEQRLLGRLKKGAPPVPGSAERKQEGSTCTAEHLERPIRGPVPAELNDMLAFLRRERTAQDKYALPLGGPQVVALYKQGDRRVRAAGDTTYYAVAAEVIVRSAVEPRGGDDRCAPPEGPGEPGVCLLASRDRGLVLACYTAEEIRSGHDPLDITRPEDGRVGRAAGLAPDGAVEAVIETGDGRTHSLPVIDNVWQGRIEADSHRLADARVRFR